MNQRTISERCVISGIGVHSGKPSRLTLVPAEIDAGIVWVHEESGEVFAMGKVAPIQAPHATVLQGKEVRMSTVEHVMAALWCLGITNVRCILEGDEAPILDGSSIAIIWALESVGIVDQDEPVSWIVPCGLIEWHDAVRNGFISIAPCNNDTPLLRYQAGDFVVDSEYDRDWFVREVAGARTSGHVEHVEVLRAQGLARGSSFGNTVVFQEKKPLNSMRMAHEAERHKLLDFMGDLYLLGMPLYGSVVAINTGHGFNREVIAHVIAHPDQWLITKDPQNISVRQYQDKTKEQHP